MRAPHDRCTGPGASEPAKVEPVVSVLPPVSQYTDPTTMFAVHEQPAADAPELHRAFESYASNDIKKLSFIEGDVLEVVRKAESGWWLCRLDGQQGWAPASYLVPFTTEELANYKGPPLTEALEFDEGPDYEFDLTSAPTDQPAQPVYGNTTTHPTPAQPTPYTNLPITIGAPALPSRPK